jgi:hypothetical protein
VIGGRHGTESTSQGGSITQNELKQAFETGVQVYVFVEQNVHSEFETYKLNKDKKDTEYRFVDNVKIFEFLEEIFSLPKNNPVKAFQTSADICSYLKAQWAGLFQRFLQNEKRVLEINVLGEMKTVSSTLQQLVTFLTEERQSKDDAIKNILLANHPAFRQFAELTGTPYRVFFSNEIELDKWLIVRLYNKIGSITWRSDAVSAWRFKDTSTYIILCENIFDNEGKLKPYTDDNWDDSWIVRTTYSTNDYEDDLPF